MDFKFSIPTIVEMKKGISNKIGNFLEKHDIKKVMIVTDKGIKDAGLLDKIEKSLQKTMITYQIFDEVIPNPSTETIEVGSKEVKSFNPDSIMAIGGGSSIDTAKAIAVMATNLGGILDYEGVGKIPNAGLPLIAIPTTAGTGSEVTASTIITNTDTLFKVAVISPYLFPTFAILDAELTINMPQEITAATGMDALTHAIESYTSKTATPVSQSFAIQAIKLIGESILNSYFVGNNVENREKMLVASMLAGMAFSQSRLGNVHAISHTLGGVFDIPHGIANATLLPFVMNYNLPSCPEKMIDIAVALGENIKEIPANQAAEKAIKTVKALNSLMNIPNNIKDLGVDINELPRLVKDSMRSGNVRINPRLTKSNDIKLIIEAAYNGNYIQ